MLSGKGALALAWMLAKPIYFRELLKVGNVTRTHHLSDRHLVGRKGLRLALTTPLVSRSLVKPKKRTANCCIKERRGKFECQEESKFITSYHGTLFPLLALQRHYITVIFPSIIRRENKPKNRRFAPMFHLTSHRQCSRPDLGGDSLNSKCLRNRRSVYCQRFLRA